MKPYRLTTEQRIQIMNKLDFMSFTQTEKETSYPKWAQGGNGWDNSGFGGTYTMMALMWYHHKHKPGSTEWRPRIILKALVKELCR